MDEKSPIIPPEEEFAEGAVGGPIEPAPDMAEGAEDTVGEALPLEGPDEEGRAEQGVEGPVEDPEKTGRKGRKTPPPELSVEEQRRRLEEETGEKEGMRRRHSRRPAGDYRHFG